MKKTVILILSGIVFTAFSNLPAQSKSHTAGRADIKKAGQVLIQFRDTTSGMVGYKDSVTNKIIIQAKYSQAASFIDGLAAVRTGGYTEYDDYNDEEYMVGGKWGFINQAGKVVVPIQYDNVEFFSEGLAAVFNDGKVGFVNKSGRVVIPIKYGYASSFQDGISIVRKSDQMTGGFGLINSKGISLTPMEYEDIRNCGEGLYEVKKNELWGLVDKSGKEKIPCKYESIRYANGFAVFQVGGKQGLVDLSGNELVPPQNKDIIDADEYGFFTIFPVEGQFYYFHTSGVKYDSRSGYCSGVAVVSVKGKYGLIDEKAAVVLPLKYDRIGVFNDGLAEALLAGKRGFIDLKGNELVPCKYDRVGSFTYDFTWTKLGDKYGFVNRQGFEISVKFDGIFEFKDNIFRTEVNGKSGFFDAKSGTEVTAPVYDHVLPAEEDYAKFNIGGTVDKDGIIVGGKWGLVNLSGKEILQLKYDYIWNFKDGLALVINGGTYYPAKKNFFGGKYGFINKNGEEVIPLIYDTASGFNNGRANVRLNGADFSIDKNGNKL